MTTADERGEPPPPPGARRDAPVTLTPFQRAVAEGAAALRPGDVVTYAELASEVGHPGSAQAVANVLRRVPGLPWWRVVPADGRLYCTHAPVQAPLLRSDGVEVSADGRVRPGSGG